MDKKRLLVLIGIGGGVLLVVILLIVGISMLMRSDTPGEEEVTTLVEQLADRQRQPAAAVPFAYTYDAEEQISSILSGITDISDAPARAALRERLPLLRDVLDTWGAREISQSERERIAFLGEQLQQLDEALLEGDIVKAKDALRFFFQGRERILDSYR